MVLKISRRCCTCLELSYFFDIDGTIYREGLITEVFKKIIKYELIEEEVWHHEVKPVYLKWDRREGDYDEYLLKMVDAYKQAILGVSKEHIEHVAQKVINQKGIEFIRSHANE